MQRHTLIFHTSHFFVTIVPDAFILVVSVSIRGGVRVPDGCERARNGRLVADAVAVAVAGLTVLVSDTGNCFGWV